jgi:TRAP-type C4-dicarboxylate transport system permease small subunit
MRNKMKNAELGVLWLNRIGEVILIIVFAVLITAVFAAVFFRYVLNNSIVWAEELARYLFVWITFVGAGLGVGKNIHVGVDAFIKKIPIGFQQRVKLCMVLGVIAFAGLLIVFGVRMTAFAMNSKALVMGFPMGFVYVSVPIGGILMLVNALILMWQLPGGNPEGGNN